MLPRGCLRVFYLFNYLFTSVVSWVFILCFGLEANTCPFLSLFLLWLGALSGGSCVPHGFH